MLYKNMVRMFSPVMMLWPVSRETTQLSDKMATTLRQSQRQSESDAGERTL